MAAGVRNLQHELAHVPGVGRTAFRAQSAVQTHVLVLGHDPAGLFERSRHKQRLLEISRWRIESAADERFVAVGRNREAVDRTDIDAGVALDAQRLAKRS